MINLTNNYYNSSDNYPQIIKYVIEGIRKFLVDTIYPDEDQTTAINERIFIADIGSSSDEAIRVATAEMGTNQNYPFTVYNLDDFEQNSERMNNKGAQSLAYFDTLGCFVSCVPIKQNILSITFTNNPDDYERLQKVFLSVQSTYTVVYVDVVFNEVTYQYPVKLSVTPTKGSYAFAFQEYLRMNGIYDLVHNFELEFYDLIFDTDSLSPIDSMTFNYENASPIDDSLNELEYTKTYVRTNLPEITSTDPIEDEEDVPVNNSIIINFNVTMDEDSVEDAITINPYFEHKLIWNDDSDILVIDPSFDLTSGTAYNISIDDSAYAFHIHDYLEEFELNFTTEG
jgi:hypothetical protein